MMQVALTRSQAGTKNCSIPVKTKTSVDNASKGKKIELIIAALSSFNSPFNNKDIFTSPSFLESVALIKRMSPGGKLHLARTLLEGLLSEGDRTNPKL